LNPGGYDVGPDPWAFLALQGVSNVSDGEQTITNVAEDGGLINATSLFSSDNVE
jgi:hypothetical protein